MKSRLIIMALTLLLSEDMKFMHNGSLQILPILPET